MTHKNPGLRGSSVVKDADLNKNKKAAAPAKKAAGPVARPPKLQLDGKKWSCVSWGFVSKVQHLTVLLIHSLLHSDITEDVHSCSLFSRHVTTIQVLKS